MWLESRFAPLLLLLISRCREWLLGQREAGERGLWLLLGEDQGARGEDAAPQPAGKELHVEPGWQLMHHPAILSHDLCALKTVTCKT